MTLPAQLDAAAAERAADQITATFTPGVSVVMADLTAAACCDAQPSGTLLKAHLKDAARIDPLADRHPLIVPTVQETGRCSGADTSIVTGTPCVA